MTQCASYFLHLTANIGFGHFRVMTGHVDVGVAEYLGDDVDRHPIFNGETGERMPGAMSR